MKHLFVVALAGILSLSALSTPAATVIYTDRTAFEAGLGAIFTEDFNDGSVDSPFSVVAPNGSLSGGVFGDIANELQTSTVWSFADAVLGFGGLWNLAVPGGPGVGLTLTLALQGGGTEVVSQEVPRGLADSFWGFISTSAFTSVTISEGTQESGIETYQLDDLTVGVSPVPLPAGLPLLLAGLMALAALRRKSA